MLPVPKAPTSFANDAAQLLSGASTVERLSGLTGLDQSAIAALIDDLEVRKEIERELAHAERSGASIRWRAREGLAVAVARIHELCAAPDISLSSLVRAGDLLTKLAGLEQPVDPSASEKFSITIIFGSEPAGGSAPQRDVIDVKARELSTDARS